MLYKHRHKFRHLSLMYQVKEKPPKITHFSPLKVGLCPLLKGAKMGLLKPPFINHTITALIVALVFLDLNTYFTVTI